MALLLDFRAWHSTLSSFMATTIINARLDGWISGYLSRTSWWGLCALDTAFWLSSKRKFLIWFLESIRIILRTGYTTDTISCLENSTCVRHESVLMLNCSILKTKEFDINTGLWSTSQGWKVPTCRVGNIVSGGILVYHVQGPGFMLPCLSFSILIQKIGGNIYFKLSGWKIKK